MDIRRFRGSAAGRSRAVAYNGFVWTVATAADTSENVAGQTRQTLASLERSLEEAGTDKTRLLSATVYLVDMTTKAQMDAVWNAWVGPNPDHWPQRACVGGALAEGALVEIVLLAAAR